MTKPILIHVVDDWSANLVRNWASIIPGSRKVSLDAGARPAHGAFVKLGAVTGGVLVVHRSALGGSLTPLLEHCEQHPGLICVVVSGEFQDGAGRDGARRYFRRAPVRKPEDPVFSRQFGRFMQSVFAGEPRFPLLEPDPPPLNLEAAGLLARAIESGADGVTTMIKAEDWEKARREFIAYHPSSVLGQQEWPSGLFAGERLRAGVVAEINLAISCARSGEAPATAEPENGASI